MHYTIHNNGLVLPSGEEHVRLLFVRRFFVKSFSSNHIKLGQVWIGRKGLYEKLWTIRFERKGVGRKGVGRKVGLPKGMGSRSCGVSSIPALYNLACADFSP